jgi:DNA-directed RNA polymerase specialized sigma24 family protein
MITTVLNRRYCSHLRRLSGPQHREITDAIALEDVRPDCQFDLIDERIETERRHDALRENVEDRLQCLPAPLRRVARLLMHHNPTTVARMLGVHNSSIYRSMQEIRTVFEEGAIEDFSQFYAEISGVLRKTSGEGTTPETRKDGAETT